MSNLKARCERGKNTSRDWAKRYYINLQPWLPKNKYLLGSSVQDFEQGSCSICNLFIYFTYLILSDNVRDQQTQWMNTSTYPAGEQENESCPHQVILLGNLYGILLGSNDDCTLQSPIYLQTSFWTSDSQKLPSSARYLAFMQLGSECCISNTSVRLCSTHYISSSLPPTQIWSATYLPTKRGRGIQVACLYSELTTQSQREKSNENFKGNADMAAFRWFTKSLNLSFDCRKTKSVRDIILW